MISVKNLNFLYGLFLLKIGQEMMFGDVLDRKEAFLDNKNMYLICPKNRKFSKGVNPWFWWKIWTFFMVCFYWKYVQKWCFLMFHIEKKPFQTINICTLYVKKIGNFPKALTHDFGQKFELSLLFVFLENRPTNDVLGCSG